MHFLPRKMRSRCIATHGAIRCKGVEENFIGTGAFEFYVSAVREKNAVKIWRAM